MCIQPEKVYHSEIYIPSELIESCLDTQRKIDKILFSKHFLDRLDNTDAKHLFTKRDVLHALLKVKKSPVVPFEIGVNGDKVSKIVVRVPFDKNSDLSLVLGLSNANYTYIITAWKNSKYDTHSTLDKSKYEQQ